MSKEELLQIVDAETGEPTGQHIQRHQVHEDKLWCRTTNIFVLNSAGEVLCHRRSLDKERFPGTWSTHFGGHIVQGESFKMGALKELEEEIGIRAHPYQLVPWRTSKKELSRIWVRDFVTVYDGAVEDLLPQAGEIDEVKWYAPRQILEQLDSEGEGGTTQSWLAGTHDFNADYQCMRAVLTAMIDVGIFGGDYKPLHKWHPPKQKFASAQ